MIFSKGKLPLSAASELQQRQLDVLKPFELLPTPIYVFLKRNQKFLGIKAPLDFFTPKEIEKLKSFESFYIPPFIEKLLPFSQAASSIKAILSSQTFDQVPPFEVSDSILHLLGDLWSTGEVIEPFFVAMVVNDLCEPLPPEDLTYGRDKSVVHLEDSIFRSSWAVFLALHLGYNDLNFLSRLRIRVFKEAIRKKKSPSIKSEIDELIQIVHLSFEQHFGDTPSARLRFCKGSFYHDRKERISQKISSRMKRITKDFINENDPVASIYGPEGFYDV